MKPMTLTEMLERARTAVANGSRWTVLHLERKYVPLNRVRLTSYAGPMGKVKAARQLENGNMLIVGHFNPAKVVEFLESRNTHYEVEHDAG